MTAQRCIIYWGNVLPCCCSAAALCVVAGRGCCVCGAEGFRAAQAPFNRQEGLCDGASSWLHNDIGTLSRKRCKSLNVGLDMHKALEAQAYRMWRDFGALSHLPCRALSSSVGLCRALSGSVELCRALSGSVRLCQALSGALRKAMSWFRKILSLEAL